MTLRDFQISFNVECGYGVCVLEGGESGVWLGGLLPHCLAVPFNPPIHLFPATSTCSLPLLAWLSRDHLKRPLYCLAGLDQVQPTLSLSCRGSNHVYGDYKLSKLAGSGLSAWLDTNTIFQSRENFAGLSIWTQFQHVCSKLCGRHDAKTTYLHIHPN